MAGKKIIIDTDMVYDDWLAILYLLGCEDVDVVAITVCGSGEARPEPGVKNLLKLLHAVGRTDIPVSTGQEQPLEGTNTFPKRIRDSIDDMLGMKLEDPDRGWDQRGAVTLLRDTLEASEEKITLFTIGPLTNIALLLHQHPELSAKLEEVFCMAGAINVPGNVTDCFETRKLKNKVAEWNCYTDPKALGEVVRIACERGVQVTLFPLDATNKAPINEQLHLQSKRQSHFRASEIAAEIILRKRQILQGGSSSWEGRYMWDPAAAVALIHPEVATFETIHVDIDTDPDSDSAGQTQRADSKAGLHVRFASDLNRETFESWFIKGIRHPQPATSCAEHDGT
ncbi:nucleoside hydrolase [Endozoicomonadaceae bacterium StTr2]